jgi:hypothetical protein
MRITRCDHDRLTIVDFPWGIGAVCFPCAAIMLAFAVNGIVRHVPTGDIIGCAIATVMCFCGGVVFTKRSEFDFDFATQRLTWRRRGLFKNTRGVVPLDQIKSATVESHSDGDGDLTYRVVLHTHAGPIPLTDIYDGNRNTADQVRTAINQALHLTLDANQQIETDILELALAGRKIDAITMARKRYGYDLTQAKRFVEELRST